MLVLLDNFSFNLLHNLVSLVFEFLTFDNQNYQVEHWKNSEVLYIMIFELQKEPRGNSSDFVGRLWL